MNTCHHIKNAIKICNAAAPVAPVDKLHYQKRAFVAGKAICKTVFSMYHNGIILQLCHR